MERHTDEAQPPALVAHRGYSLCYPESTLPAIEAALEVGAGAVEFDVHMTADEVPVLLHDAHLRRTGGVGGRIMDFDLEQARRIEVNETSRLGSAFSGVRIPTLAETVSVLADWPGVDAFVEIKRESLRCFGTARVVERVLEAVEPIAGRCVVISYDAGAVERARAAGALRIGWVIDSWGASVRQTAETLAPDYLLCNHAIIPRECVLWPGPWRWVLFTVDDAERALELAARGADLIETNAIGELLGHPRLRRRTGARARQERDGG